MVAISSSTYFVIASRESRMFKCISVQHSLLSSQLLDQESMRFDEWFPWLISGMASIHTQILHHSLLRIKRAATWPRFTLERQLNCNVLSLLTARWLTGHLMPQSDADLCHLMWLWNPFSLYVQYNFCIISIPCFDAVGLVTGKASGNNVLQREYQGFTWETQLYLGYFGRVVEYHFVFC